MDYVREQEDEENIFEAVRKSLLPALFGETPPGFYTNLAQHLYPTNGTQAIPAGSRIFYPGKDGLVVIHQGVVEVSQLGGKEKIQRNSTVIFGAETVMKGVLPPITVYAVTRCRVSYVALEEIRGFLDQYHTVKECVADKATFFEYLRDAGMFSECRPLFVASVAAQAQRIVLREEEVLWTKGSRARGVSLLIRGELDAVVAASPQDRRRATLYGRVDGSVVGLEEYTTGQILPGTPLSQFGGIGISTTAETTVVAVEDTLVMEIPLASFWDTLAQPLFQTERAHFIECAKEPLQAIISAEGRPVLATEADFLEDAKLSQPFITYLRQQYDTQPQLVKPTEPICVSGEDGTCLHFLIHGEAKSESGKLATQGRYFSISNLFGGDTVELATVVAQSFCWVERIPASAMLNAMAQYPKDGLKLKGSVAQVMPALEPARRFALIRDVPLFEKWHDTAIAFLAERTTVATYVLGETIADPRRNTLQIVEKGSVEVISEGKNKLEVPSGGVIGQNALLGVEEARDATYRASSIVSCVSLCRDALYAAVSEYPQYREGLRVAVRERTKRTTVAAGSGFTTAPKFTRCNPRFLYLLDLFSTNVVFLPSETIVEEGDSRNKDMFHISEGTCEVYIKGKRVAEMTAGTVFGEMTILGYSPERTVTVKAKSCVVTQRVTQRIFENTLKEFPSEVRLFHDMAAERTVGNMHLDGSVLRNVPFFSHCSDAFIDELRDELQPKMYLPGTDIVVEGTTGTECQILYEGTADVVINGAKVNEINPVTVFGELCALGVTRLRTATITANTSCFTHMVHKAVLDSIFERYPVEREGCMTKAATQMKQRLVSVFHSEMVPLFAGLEARDSFVQSVLELVDTVRILDEGDVIHGEDEPGSMFYILLIGTVAIRTRGALVNVLEVGSFFGEMAVMHPGSLCGEYLCQQDGSEILCFDAGAFRALLEKFPAAYDRVAKTALDRKGSLLYARRKLERAEQKKRGEVRKDYLRLVSDMHLIDSALRGERDVWDIIMTNDDVAEECAAKLVLHHFRPGELVFDAAIHERGFLFLRDGILDCMTATPSGAKQLVGRVYPGSVFGDVVCMGTMPRGMYALYAPQYGQCSCFFLKKRLMLKVLERETAAYESVSDRLLALVPSRVENYESLCSRYGPLEGLKLDAAKLIAMHSAVTRYAPGEVVCENGDFGDNLFVVIDGTLKVVEAIGKPTIEVLRPLACFGGLNVLDMEKRYCATLVVPKDAASHTAVRIIRRRDLLGALWFERSYWPHATKWLREWRDVQIAMQAKLMHKWRLLRTQLISEKPRPNDDNIKQWVADHAEECEQSQFRRLVLREDDFDSMMSRKPLQEKSVSPPRSPVRTGRSASSSRLGSAPVSPSRRANSTTKSVASLPRSPTSPPRGPSSPPRRSPMSPPKRGPMSPPKRGPMSPPRSPSSPSRFQGPQMMSPSSKTLSLRTCGREKKRDGGKTLSLVL